MKNLFLISFVLFLFRCTGDLNQDENQAKDYDKNGPRVTTTAWSNVDTIDVEAINKDLTLGKPTLDVGIYFPSNLDPDFDKITLTKMLESFMAEKEIYETTSVQINLLWVKTGEIDPRFLSIQANETPGIPKTEYVNIYEHMRRHPARLTKETKQAFESMIESDPDNHRTIYLIGQVEG